MIGGVRCPYCDKKLLEGLDGSATVRCRHCKHLVALVGEDVDLNQELARLLSMVANPVTTKRLADGRYEHTLECSN